MFSGLGIIEGDPTGIFVFPRVAFVWLFGTSYLLTFFRARAFFAQVIEGVGLGDQVCPNCGLRF